MASEIGRKINLKSEVRERDGKEREKMTVGAGIHIDVTEKKLLVLGKELFSDVHDNVILTQCAEDAFVAGAFIGVDSDRLGSRRVFSVGKLECVFFTSSIIICFLCFHAFQSALQ